MTHARARTAVAAAIAGYRAEVGAETLRLFRIQLQAGVRRASPLALTLARSEGFDLVDRLERLRPDPRWLDGPALAGVPCVPASERPAPASAGPMQPSLLAYDHPLAFEDHERAQGPLSFGVAHGALQVFGRLGTCGLLTAGAIARLFLPANVPETLLDGARGRRLDEVVDHAALRGRGYVIRDVLRPTVRDGSVLLFRAGTVPFAMPWRGLLRAELASTTPATGSPGARLLGARVRREEA